MVPTASPVSEPPPVLVTDSVAGAGSPVVIVSRKVTAALERAMVGLAVTVKVTTTPCGLLDASADATDTVAWYVPAASVPVAGCSVRTAGAVAGARVAVSQPVGSPEPYAMPETASPVSGPKPPLVTAIVCAAGFAPPAPAVKLALP